MTRLGTALLAELSPEDLCELAAKLAPYLPTTSGTPDTGWLDSRHAADYLGVSLHALHRLTAERRIEFSQDKPGGRCYFKRADLDKFREATP